VWSELVHVPANATGPDLGEVAQALMNAIKAPAKRIRREGCIFMFVDLVWSQKKVKLRLFQSTLSRFNG
jgi:hypothetical protein